MSPGDKVVMLTPLPTGVLDSFLPPEAKLSQALALAAPDSAGSSDPTNAPNRWAGVAERLHVPRAGALLAVCVAPMGAEVAVR